MDDLRVAHKCGPCGSLVISERAVLLQMIFGRQSSSFSRKKAVSDGLATSSVFIVATAFIALLAEHSTRFNQRPGRIFFLFFCNLSRLVVKTYGFWHSKIFFIEYNLHFIILLWLTPDYFTR